MQTAGEILKRMVAAFREGRDLQKWIAAADKDRQIIQNYDPMIENTKTNPTDLNLVTARYNLEFAKTAQAAITLGTDFLAGASSFGAPETALARLTMIGTKVAQNGIDMSDAGYVSSFSNGVRDTERQYIQEVQRHTADYGAPPE